MNVFFRNRSSRQSSGGGSPFQNLARHREIRWAGAAILLLAIGFVAWLGFQGVRAKSNLEQSRNYAQQAKDALLSGKAEDATRFAENAQLHAKQAHSATHSLPWNIAAAVPLAGSPLKTTQQITEVVVGLADGVLLPAARMGATVSPDKLISGTRIDLQLLRSEQPRLSELSATAAKLDAAAQAIPDAAFLSPVRQARSQLQDQTSKLAQLLRDTALASQLAPSMMGADGPRTYLMAFQNNAEARGTGGLLGGFGIVRFDDGRPVVDTLAPNTELDEAVASVDLGPEFNKVYGWTNPYTDFRNSNMSPHFPYAAEIWKSMWERQADMRIDGVIALDPVALSYLLHAIGPVTLANGELINETNVVELTQSTAYSRFPPVARAPKGMSPDESARYDRAYAATLRKKYLQEIANAVVKRMAGPLPAPRLLLDALGKAAGEGRIAVWSASPSDQKLLAETPLAHSVPNDGAPYAAVIVNNLAGNKMDYYLRRQIEYAADECKGDVRNSTITVTLTNTAATDESLPEYVSGSPGLVNGLPLAVPSGTMVTSVRLLGTKGATLMSVTSNGERTPAITQTENGHPSFEVQVAIPPGTGGELVFRLSEPTAPGEPRVPIQPLIDEVNPRIVVPTCS